VKLEQEFNNKIRYVTGKIKVKEIYYAIQKIKHIFIIKNMKVLTRTKVNKESVIEQFKKEMFDKHDFMEASPE
jgi:hypothetical protein